MLLKKLAYSFCWICLMSNSAYAADTVSILKINSGAACIALPLLSALFFSLPLSTGGQRRRAEIRTR